MEKSEGVILISDSSVGGGEEFENNEAILEDLDMSEPST